MITHHDVDEGTELFIKELDISEIHPVNVNDTTQGAKYICIGAPGTGKSSLIKNIIYNKKHIIPVGHVFSGTEDSNKFFSSFFPESFIFSAEDLFQGLGKKENINDHPVTKFKKRQLLTAKFFDARGINPWALEIFDDCTSDPRCFKKNIFQDLYKNGRWWRMLHIASFQFCLDLPTSMRTNINGVFIFKEGNPKMRDRLFDNYSDGGMDRHEFDYIMDSLTDDYTSMYINKKAKSNRTDDTIQYYKADINIIPRDWKFGCKDFWNFHYERYDPNS